VNFSRLAPALQTVVFRRVDGESAGARTQDQRLKRAFQQFRTGSQGVAATCRTTMLSMVFGYRLEWIFCIESHRIVFACITSVSQWNGNREIQKSYAKRVALTGEWMPRKARKVVGVYERELGSDIWCARLRVSGKLVRKSFGRGTPGRKEAEAWVEKARTIKRTGEGVLPTSAKRPVLTSAEVALLGDPSAITVGRLCDEFQKYVVANPDEYRDQKNPPTRIAAIKARFGTRDASHLKSSEVEEWLDDVQADRDLANATYNKLRGTFSMIYKHGKRRDLTSVNPAADVPLKDVGNAVERYMSKDEERRLRKVLLDAIDSHDQVKQPELRKQAIHRMMEFDVSIRSGMRRSEQYNLRWSDVDFDAGTMRLRITKSGKPRNAFIIADVAKALHTLRDLDLGRRDRSREQLNLAPKDSVFSKADNKKWWAAALEGAEIVDYRWHDNRHSFCSRLVQAGIHLKIVQEAAGHASIASTMRYAHVAPTQVADAMAVLNWSDDDLRHGA
jgi:site-specific recombinase XerD